MTGGFALVVVPLVVVCFAARTVLVLATRARSPRFAAFVNERWTWGPLVIVLVGAFVLHPVIGAVALAATAWCLTSARAIGSPFRPRRR